MKICAVMVTHNPDLNLRENIRALLPHVSRLIVVDNCSDPTGRSLVQSIASASDFHVIWNEKNLGIASALNAGIRACPFREKVALIGPYHLLFPEIPEERKLRGRVTPPFEERTVMLQSGSLIRSHVFRVAGMPDDSFFIDYVDFEYCLRLRKHGFRIIEARNAVLAHEIGKPTSHKVIYKSCVVYNHSPIRRYYAVRNRLRLYVRYLFREPGWILHDAWSWLKELIKLMMFESDKAGKLRCMARGVWDAMRCRSGPMEGTQK